MTYGSITFASRVLDYERIQGTPFQWWARSESLTTEDGILWGGLFGFLSTSRSAAIQTLSTRSRPFARLGAMCIGSAVGIAGSTTEISFRLGRGPAEFQELGRLHHVRHESLLALSRDPIFVQTLNRTAREYLIAQINENRNEQENAHDADVTIKVMQDVKTEVKKALMPLSWLDASAYGIMQEPRERKGDRSIERYFHRTATSPEEKLDLMIAEASLIAARLRPRVLKALDLGNSVPEPQYYDALKAEYGFLVSIQADLVREIVELKRSHDPSITIRDLLASLDPDAPHIQHHMPSSSIMYCEATLRKLRNSPKRDLIESHFGMEIMEAAIRDIIEELKMHRTIQVNQGRSDT